MPFPVVTQRQGPLLKKKRCNLASPSQVCYPSLSSPLHFDFYPLPRLEVLIVSHFFCPAPTPPARDVDQPGGAEAEQTEGWVPTPPSSPPSAHPTSPPTDTVVTGEPVADPTIVVDEGHGNTGGVEAANTTTAPEVPPTNEPLRAFSSRVQDAMLIPPTVERRYRCQLGQHHDGR